MAQLHPIPPVDPTARLLGASPAITAMRAQLRHLAAFDTPGGAAVPTVLLQGETGTGKGLVARLLHESGPRARGPFVEVNCAAIPEALLEAELFGFAAGAFTDAKRAKPGLFEVASGGTLFLDEIDSLPLALQGKLLTAIEAKRVRSVGSVTEHPVDVKLTVATQADLGALAAQGRFRADLYYRLAVIPLAVPPLRARGADVVQLAQHYLRWYAAAHGVRPQRLSRTAEAWLRHYTWPGNVRELSHLMERVTVLHPEALVEPHTLERLCLSRVPVPVEAAESSLEEHVAVDEPTQIRQALAQTEGNVAQAARRLGWSRKAMRYRLRQHGIEAPGRPRGRPSRVTHQDEGAATAPPEAPSTPDPGGERKPVAVLAIALTLPEASATAPPFYEPWTAARHWEQVLIEKVQGFGGTPIQRAPSLWLVAFGLPSTLDQLPQRAVQTALALRHLVAESQAAAGEAPSPAVRQAVHWGYVLAGGPAQPLLAVGDTLDLPVRLLGQAAPGELLVSPPVAAQLEGEYALEPCEGPVGAVPSERLRASQVRGRLHQRAASARLLSPFVGRVRELAALEECWAQAEAGQGQVVGLIGEAGVGKSRLLEEFRQRLAGRRVTVLEGRGVAYGGTIPYLPVAELLRAYTQIDSADDDHVIRAKLTVALHALDARLSPGLPALLALLDVPVEDSAWQALEPSQRRQQTIEAVSRVLLRASQAVPLLAVVENLHWVDRETEAVLGHLIGRLPGARLLLLLTTRPEYRPPWAHKSTHTQLHLEPLPPPQAEALLARLLGADPGLQPLTRRLIERTDGNPLFLEESVRTLVETGVIVGTRGAYRLAQLPPTLAVPSTVQAVLAARLDRLPPTAKRLLQEAAVLGREVPLTLLAAVAGRPPAALERGLSQLQAAEFLYEADAWPAPVYRFTHALSCEVAYESLPPARRRALHVQVMAALEQTEAAQRAAHVDWLAYHAVRGAAWEPAVRYCRQAGAKALAQSAHQEAAVYLEQALEALRHLPERHETLVQGIDLRLELRTALQALGAFGQIHAHLQAAEALAQRLADPGRQGWAAAYLSAHAFNMGAPGQAHAAGQRALGLARARGDAPLEVMATYVAGLAALAQGHYAEALRHLGTPLDALTREHPREPFGLPGPAAVLAGAWAAWGLAELGAFAEARARGEGALRLAEAAEHPFAMASALEALGVVCLRQGALPEAVTFLEQGLLVCERWQLPLRVSSLEALLGYACTLEGRVQEALPRLEAAMAQATAMGRLVFQALWVVYRGEAVLQAGQWREAQPLVAQALALARTHQEAGSEAWALRLLGDLHARRPRPAVAAAEAAYRQAITRADELGMRPLLAHCHVGLGALYRQAGRRAQAQTEGAAALELYRAMGMTRWCAQAEALLVQADGP